MHFLKKASFGIILNGVSLYLLTYLVEEITYTGGFTVFVIGGVLLGLLNSFVKPLLKLVSVPFIIITGGLFLFVINALILWFLSYFLQVAAFRDATIVFPNLGTYVIGAVVFGLINWTLHLFIKND